MSRLYTWLETDAIKTTHTARGHKETEVTINYGSRGDSKRLIRVFVKWDKEQEKPEIYIDCNKKAKRHLFLC